MGGFIWVVILSVIFLVQHRVVQGLLGLALASVAVALIFYSAPWKHPDTPFWKLMLPIYVALFVTIAWAAWSYDGLDKLGLSGWSVFLVLPLLIPFATVGRKRWTDNISPNNSG